MDVGSTVVLYDRMAFDHRVGWAPFNNANNDDEEEEQENKEDNGDYTK